MQPTEAWVFVSHASDDLLKVRQVRNFMEEKGAAPILFYLRSLSSPEQFWPLIEQEIAARNFFLLCDSKFASASPWVERERNAVNEISKQRPIRIGRVSLDKEPIDLRGIEKFLLNLRVYVVHPDTLNTDTVARVLDEFGYGLIGAVGFSPEGLNYLKQGGQANDDLFDMMAYGANRGWLMIFLGSMMSESIELFSFLQGLPSGRTIFVSTDKNVNMGRFHAIPGAIFVDSTETLRETTRIAARKMLMGTPD